MTVTEEFISVEEDQFEAAAPVYPTAFGITLTPQVGGILIAVLGLAGSLYLLFNQVMPAWQKYQELEASRNEKQTQVQQKQATLTQNQRIKADLALAKQQKAEVLALFADEKTLNTLLLDLNRLVVSSNARLQQSSVKAKLNRFVPASQSVEVITDGSLGAEVNGKLKRRMVNVEFQGTFEQTQSILRNIERLQPLLILKEFQSTLAQPASDPQNKVVSGPATITTSFQLQAILPASPEEAANAAAPAK